MAKIRNRVKELRIAREWTQQELADAVGVSRQTVTNWLQDGIGLEASNGNGSRNH